MTSTTGGGGGGELERDEALGELMVALVGDKVEMLEMETVDESEALFLPLLVLRNCWPRRCARYAGELAGEQAALEASDEGGEQALLPPTLLGGPSAVHLFGLWLPVPACLVVEMRVGVKVDNFWLVSRGLWACGSYR